MKIAFALLSLLVSLTAFADLNCKLKSKVSQNYVRCFCEYFEVSCKVAGKNQTFFALPETKVSCDNATNSDISDCKLGGKISILKGQSLSYGKLENDGVTIKNEGQYIVQ